MKFPKFYSSLINKIYRAEIYGIAYKIGHIKIENSVNI